MSRRTLASHLEDDESLLPLQLSQTELDHARPLAARPNNYPRRGEEVRPQRSAAAPRLAIAVGCRLSQFEIGTRFVSATGSGSYTVDK